MQFAARRVGAGWLQSRSGQQNHAAAATAAFEVRPVMTDILKRALPWSKRSTEASEPISKVNDIHHQSRDMETDIE